MVQRGLANVAFGGTIAGQEVNIPQNLMCRSNPVPNCMVLILLDLEVVESLGVHEKIGATTAMVRKIPTEPK